jgi:hypothetical protein
VVKGLPFAKSGGGKSNDSDPLIISRQQSHTSSNTKALILKQALSETSYVNSTRHRLRLKQQNLSLTPNKLRPSLKQGHPYPRSWTETESILLITQILFSLTTTLQGLCLKLDFSDIALCWSHHNYLINYPLDCEGGAIITRLTPP